MKKYFTILVLLLVQMNAAKAQTNVYHPFPDSNAVWNFNYSLVCMMWPGGSTHANYSIIISGDTIINNTQYKKLYIPAVDLNMSGTCNEPNGGYKGAIRQDTTNRKVYIIPPVSVSEVLLYDFSMQVGDTLKGYLTQWFFSPDTVQAIDSILIGNSYRKRWVINYCYDFYLIEGIGSTYGLTEQSPGCILDCCPGIYLTCFKQDNQILYPDTATTCEIITVSVDEKENMEHGITIFPNPASDVLNISFNVEKPGDVALLLYNLLGQETIFLLSEKVNIGENNINVSVADMPDGIYFLKLLINENVITKKIIKYKL
jgi:hypothetical protein